MNFIKTQVLRSLDSRVKDIIFFNLFIKINIYFNKISNFFLLCKLFLLKNK